MKKKIVKVIQTLIIMCIAIVFFLPFCMVLSASFTTGNSLKQYGYSIFPHKFSLTAYEFIIENSLDTLLSSYAVTIFVTMVGTLLGMIIMCGMAYPLSRKDFRYGKIISFFLYFTMLFSGGTVPTYILISNYLKMKDTIWVLILPMLLNAWNIFLLRTYFAAVPKEMVEAAKVDGLSEIGIFVKIIAPLSLPGIATISLFTLLAYWNEWFSSMLYINKNEIVSLQYMLVQLLNDVEFMSRNAGMFSDLDIPKENIRMATCILAAGPMMMVFPFFQKYFVKGMMVGSIKG